MPTPLRPVPSRCGLVWSLRILLAAAVLIALLCWLLPIGSLAWNASIVALILAALFFAAFYFPQRARTTLYQLTDQQIVLQSGVFFSQTRILRFADIQCVSLLHTPLQTLWKLRTVCLFVPGRVFVLDAVDRKTAEQLAARVLGQQKN